MLFNRNKNKKKTIENPFVKKHISVGDMYLESAACYINYQGKLRGIENPLDNKEFYEEIAGDFYKAVMHFVNYLENTYTDDILTNDEVIELDLNKMLEGSNSTTLDLFSSPQFPELIYLNESLYSTHFHIYDNKIIESEGVQVLPGLSDLLANEKINKLFNGLTPIEARELLKQMGIYPKDTELDLVIENYKERQNVQYSFYKSVICLLLLRRSNYGIKRGRLFADSLGFSFDFKPFEKEAELRMKKTL
jgi:hypothetical protein